MHAREDKTAGLETNSGCVPPINLTMTSQDGLPYEIVHYLGIFFIYRSIGQNVQAEE